MAAPNCSSGCTHGADSAPSALKCGRDRGGWLAQPAAEKPNAILFLSEANVHHLLHCHRLLVCGQETRSRHGHALRSRPDEHRDPPKAEQQPHPKEHSAVQHSPAWQQEKDDQREQNAED